MRKRKSAHAIYQSIDDESKRPDYIVDSIDEIYHLPEAEKDN